MAFTKDALEKPDMNEESDKALSFDKGRSSPSFEARPMEFDYQSTTPCDPAVLAAMEPYWNQYWGNASSRHSRMGLHASAAVSLAREQLAAFLKIQPERLIFTSGATEANNLALLGHARARALELGRPGHLITLATEHHAVLDPLRQLQREGFRLTELRPGLDGLLSAEKLLQAFEKDTFLVSVMMANNEIGVVQPISELTGLCKERGVAFHSDLAQTFGHLPIDLNQLGLDFMSVSGHKLYGPKGIGALVISSEFSLMPLQWGGGQEQGLRPGTIPVPLVIGLVKAAELAMQDLHSRYHRLRELRNQLWEGLLEQIPNLIINGSMEQRLPNNLNFTVPGVRGNQLHRELRSYLSCSSGSACSRGAPSHVLLTLGRTPNEAEASLRMSLGRDTTSEEVVKAVRSITKVVNELRE